MMRNQHIYVLSLVLACLVSTGVAADAGFSQLNLSPEDELVFRAEVHTPGLGVYGAGIGTIVPDGPSRLLTVFPENVQYLAEIDQIQIRNRFGVFRLRTDTSGFETVERFPGFLDGRGIPVGRLDPVVASPNGRYLVHIERQRPSSGRLVLTDVRTGNQTTVTERAERVDDGEPARFSPDGRFFVYSVAGELYYFPIEQFQQGRLTSERYRNLGKGLVSNARFSENGDLYLVRGRLVYRISTNELFARSLFRNTRSTGDIRTELPFTFDAATDDFRLAPDGRTALFTTRSGHLSFVLLERSRQLTALPRIHVPQGSRVEDIAWTNDGYALMLVSAGYADSATPAIYRVAVGNRSEETSVRRVTESVGAHTVSMSPDSRYFAVADEKRVVVRDYPSLDPVRSIPSENAVSVLWIDGDRLFVGDRSLNRIVEVSSGEETLLAFSDAELVTFESGWQSVVLSSGGRTARVDPETLRLDETDRLPGLQPQRLSSDRFRVYIDTLSSGQFRNQIMIRDIASLATRPLFALPARDVRPFPEREEAVDFDYFQHGSRLRARELSLVFNVAESAAGLDAVLSTLNDYSLTATFFVGGDFIRRNPEAVRHLAESGHEIGSLFFTNIDLTDAELSVDDSFIQQGLAATEDAYYELTGQELSLMWHAPYYAASSSIRDAASEIGYRYIGRDVDSLDWVPEWSGPRPSSLYQPSAALLDRVVQRVEPGSIVNITLGIPGEAARFPGREDYLWQRLAILMDEVHSLGFDVVPVSTLIDRARQ